METKGGGEDHRHGLRMTTVSGINFPRKKNPNFSTVRVLEKDVRKRKTRRNVVIGMMITGERKRITGERKVDGTTIIGMISQPNLMVVVKLLILENQVVKLLILKYGKQEEKKREAGYSKAVKQ